MSAVANLGKLVLCVLIGGLLLAAGIYPGLFALGNTADYASSQFLALPGDLIAPPTSQTSYVYASDGKTLITSFYDENRHDVPLADISADMQLAIIAAEDARFYQHAAVDMKAIARAIVANERGGQVEQGASTLTMQYVRNVLKTDPNLTPEQREAAVADTAARKIQEIRYAVTLEQNLSKDEILDRYLNIAYFGDGAYGIYAAAQTYFSELPSQLTLAAVRHDRRHRAEPRRRQPGARLHIGRADPPDLRAERARRHERDHARPGDHGIGHAARAAARRPRPTTAPPYPRRRIRGVSSATTSCSGGTGRPRSGSPSPTGSGRSTRAATASSPRWIRRSRRSRRRKSLSIYGYDNRKALPARRRAAGHRTTCWRWPSTGTTASPRTRAASVTTPTRSSNSSRAARAWPATRPDRRSSSSPCWPRSNSGSRSTPRSSRRRRSSPGGRAAVRASATATAGARSTRTRSTWTASARCGPGYGRSVNTYWVWMEEQIGPENAVAMAQRLGIVFRAKTDAELAADHADTWGAFTLGVVSTTPLDLVNAYATVAAGGIYCAPLPVRAITSPTGASLAVADPQCHRVVSPDIAAAAADAARCPVAEQSYYGQCDGGTAPVVPSILGLAADRGQDRQFRGERDRVVRRIHPADRRRRDRRRSRRSAGPRGPERRAQRDRRRREDAGRGAPGPAVRDVPGAQPRDRLRQRSPGDGHAVAVRPCSRPDAARPPTGNPPPPHTGRPTPPRQHPTPPPVTPEPPPTTATPPTKTPEPPTST